MSNCCQDTPGLSEIETEGWHFLNMQRTPSYTDCQGKSVGWIHAALQRDLMSPAWPCNIRNTALGYFSAWGGHRMLHRWIGNIDAFLMTRGLCVCRHVRRTRSVEVACVVPSACGSGACECAFQWVKRERSVIQWATRFIYSLSGTVHTKRKLIHI